MGSENGKRGEHPIEVSKIAHCWVADIVAAMVPSGMWLEIRIGAISEEVKLSNQAATSIG